MKKSKIISVDSSSIIVSGLFNAVKAELFINGNSAGEIINDFVRGPVEKPFVWENMLHEREQKSTISVIAEYADHSVQFYTTTWNGE